ncbi:MAG: DNA-processing protein DprA [Prevotellaceae bacterium]|jgi:DNA processing protein|nr:DNA-processing protein DprA [Prevotellaceae bacterium]
MDAQELIHTIALTQVPGIGCVRGRILLQAAGSAVRVFHDRRYLAQQIPGISRKLLALLDCPQAIERAQREYEFTVNNQIACLSLLDERYPKRLRECEDAPLLLFFRGNADLNQRRIVSIVGTRRPTDYGRQLCESFMRDLHELCPDVLIISGLAYGIDIKAHTAALSHGLDTIGVLAHGLDRIYPSVHRKIAIEMLQHGGLLTEYLTGTQPESYNFVARNRIVAGISDATVVVESPVKGGSLITADLAGGYHRDCFAFSGRACDTNSQGCNALIRDNKAALIQSAADLVEAMRWGSPNERKTSTPERQPSLFPDLTPDERAVVSLLEKGGELQLNTLLVDANVPIHQLHSTLFELEMKGVIRTLAGGMYRLA